MPLRDLQQQPYPFIFNDPSYHQNEINTVENIVCEGIWIYGQPLYYIERKLVNEISGFQEFKTKVMKNAYFFRGFVENLEQFDGQNMFTKFGLQLQDSFDLYVPKSFFNNEQIIKTKAPKPQDLIYWSYTDKLFEIQYVTDENFASGHYTLTSNFMYKLTCQLFKFDYSEIDIDQLSEDLPQTDFEKLEKLLDLNDRDVQNDNIKIENENVELDVIDDTEKNALLR